MFRSSDDHGRNSADEMFGRGRLHRPEDPERHHFASGHGPRERGGRGFGFGGWSRGVVRRGDVRSAILALLLEGPMHGYQVMQQLSDRSGGLWQPSAGSIYPTLQQLEDEGLVVASEQDGRRIFSLTDTGRTAAAERAARGPAPWQVAGANEATDVRRMVVGLFEAVNQVTKVGSPEDVASAAAILTQARRDIYRLLAQDTTSDSSGRPPSPA